ncbi:hypothetical protein B0A49_12375, partial [Cryomyces minteri]
MSDCSSFIDDCPYTPEAEATKQRAPADGASRFPKKGKGGESSHETTDGKSPSLRGSRGTYGSAIDDRSIMTDSDQGRRPEEKTGPIRSVADRTGGHFRNNSSSTQSYIDIGSTIPDDPARSQLDTSRTLSMSADLLRRLHKATNPSDLRSESDNKPPVATQHKQKPSKPRKRSPARDASHARRAAVELPILLSPLVIKSKKGKAVLIAVPDAQPTAKRDPSKEATARKPTTPVADAHGPEEATTPTRATVWESPAAKRPSPRAVITGKDGRLTTVDLPQPPWVPPPAPSSGHASPPSRDAIAKTKE